LKLDDIEEGYAGARPPIGSLRIAGNECVAGGLKTECRLIHRHKRKLRTYSIARDAVI
jgi:hypothetical protein